MRKVTDKVNVVRQVTQISFLHWREGVKNTQQEKKKFSNENKKSYSDFAEHTKPLFFPTKQLLLLWNRKVRTDHDTSSRLICTLLLIFIGSTSAKLEPIRALSLIIPQVASSIVKFIGRHRPLAFAMLLDFRRSNFLSSFSLPDSSKRH